MDNKEAGAVDYWYVCNWRDEDGDENVLTIVLDEYLDPLHYGHKNSPERLRLARLFAQEIVEDWFDQDDDREEYFVELRGMSKELFEDAIIFRLGDEDKKEYRREYDTILWAEVFLES